MDQVIYFVTSNDSKIANAKIALAPFGITVKQKKMDFVESRSEDPADIALEKARQAYEELGHPVIVEDSGFFINALGGFPMTHIKFSLKTLGIENILKMMDGVSDRSAEWRMTLAYVWGQDLHKIFTFIEPGVITDVPRLVKRPTMSDYWRIYIPTILKSNTKALSEMEDTDLKAWQEFYANNNQFQMFGRWFKEQK